MNWNIQGKRRRHFSAKGVETQNSMFEETDVVYAENRRKKAKTAYFLGCFSLEYNEKVKSEYK